MKWTGIFLLGILLSGPGFLWAQLGRPGLEDRQWADSVLNTLTLDQKVGQLMMLAAYSKQSTASQDYLASLLRTYEPGGLIFMQGTPKEQVPLVNRFQALSNVPLLMAQDAEWGLDMRLEEGMAYPRNLTLGAIRNDSMLYQLGARYAYELKRVGMQVNFAPVIDVNNNPANPVINQRAFGEDRFNVARKGIMLSRGMEDHGVMACVKHFPGHGDTDVDSHFDLPVIDHPLARLDTLELYPFARALEAGVGAVMVAHLHIPALDDTPNRPSSLSPRIVQGLIRDSLHYGGLIFTDGLVMQGVTKYYPGGKAALQAFKAGNDLLLTPADLPGAVSAIKQAVKKGEVLPATLDERVHRILAAKYRLGLHRWQPLPVEGIGQDLHSLEAKVLRKRLYEAAMTLVKNDRRLVPLEQLDRRKVAYLQIGGGSGNTFDRALQKYGEIRPFYLRHGFTAGEGQDMLAKLADYNTVIVGVYGMNHRPSQRFGITPQIAELCGTLGLGQKETVLTLFGTPYALQYVGREQAILVAYEAVPEAEQAAAAAIFGGQPVTGRLPVSGSDLFPAGWGIDIEEAVRFGFAWPEEKGMDSRVLARIDTLAQTYIDQGAMPGCQILVMRGKDIVYEKGWGKTEYAGGVPIDPLLHTYDLASVTKVTATTLSVMRLVEQGLLDLDKPLATYLPELRGTDKARLTPRRLLQHNAGLPSWIPFYVETFADPARHLLDRQYYSFAPPREPYFALANGLYARMPVQQLVWDKIREAPVRRSSQVRYSDIGLILMGRVVERLTGESLASYVGRNFYQPLGMSHTYFNPHLLGKEKFCPPTEADTLFRKTIIQGYVHDPAAAMMGGVAGHAGLFANAYDLAKLLLMLKNGGHYGRELYLRPGTLDYFTRRQLANSRKGLGWDKPEIHGHKSNPASVYASAQTFGHTGFTGTCVWVDPVYDLVFIFLSNRTFPYASNRMLLHENVRTRIMDTLYASIFHYEGKALSQP